MEELFSSCGLEQASQDMELKLMQDLSKMSNTMVEVE